MEFPSGKANWLPQGVNDAVNTHPYLIVQLVRKKIQNRERGAGGGGGGGGDGWGGVGGGWLDVCLLVGCLTSQQHASVS